MILIVALVSSSPLAKASSLLGPTLIGIRPKGRAIVISLLLSAIIALIASGKR
jgi:hypothetical protein